MWWWLLWYSYCWTSVHLLVVFLLLLVGKQQKRLARWQKHQKHLISSTFHAPMPCTWYPVLRTVVSSTPSGTRQRRQKKNGSNAFFTITEPKIMKWNNTTTNCRVNCSHTLWELVALMGPNARQLLLEPLKKVYLVLGAAAQKAKRKISRSRQTFRTKNRRCCRWLTYRFRIFYSISSYIPAHISTYAYTIATTACR